MKNYLKLSIVFVFLILFLTPSNTKIVSAAENQIHKNDKHQYELDLPKDWTVTIKKNSELYLSPKKDVMVVVSWEILPRSDPYGAYLLDEMNQNEKDAFQYEVEFSFEKSMDSITFIQSRYVQMLNGHQAFVLATTDKNGPLVATILIRGDQTFFIIGKAMSPELFDINRDVIEKITNSFKIR